jgi:hypothetical protein
MVEDGSSQDHRDAAAGAAIGMAARRGLLGGGQGGSGGLGAGLSRARAAHKSGSGLLTAIVVVCVLFGMLAVMFFMNAK